ncbi:LysM peptidoglycan-binding domain-containing protein [Pseudomonas aeruginosa]|uniref:LysM peptidoglycan-binding domain-containing protein n=1 Tax=Pseudomonas aeruginosa TaxID=287 RepID=UPI003A4E225D
MSSIQHQLIEQCVTRLRSIVEALDNIHDNTPHRWSTDLDEVHSSAESLLAMIKDQAPARSETSFEEWLANELEGEDGQPVPAAVCDIALARRAFNHWPKLEQPAKVGGVRFSAGVSSRLVVEAAQRLYEFESTPEKEAERIERLQAFREQLDPLNLAPHAEAFNEAPAEALKSEQAEAELEKQEPVGEVRESGGTLTAVIVRHSYATKLPVGTKLYAAPVAQAQQLHDLDKQCRDDVARALGLRPSQERGFAWSYLLASIKSCVKASEDAAQAQHSVPAYVSYTTRPAESLAGIALRQLKDESRWVEIRDINAHAFPDMQSHSYYPAGTVIKLPAAAPGKKVPQAWLDVQAERLRQVEAEGWMPEHDDAHSHGEMARAAACYALAGSSAPNDGTAALLVSLAWPWDEQWWKPTSARRDLIKACALGLAEIERLDRAGISQNPQPGATTASS